MKQGNIFNNKFKFCIQFIIPKSDTFSPRSVKLNLKVCMLFRRTNLNHEITSDESSSKINGQPIRM